MKKVAIALTLVSSAVASQAFAQTNVSITGFVKAGYENYKLSNIAGATYKSENRISDQSSRIIFSGVEDLGGGLKAWFQLDNRTQIDMGQDVASGFVNGTNGVGLQSDSWGKIGIGRFDLYYNEGEATEKGRAISDQTLVTHSLLAEVNGVRIARVSRSSNTVRYDSPNFSGFNASVAYSFAPMGNEGSGLVTAGNSGSAGGAFFAAARYVNGPINAGLSYWDYKVEGSTVGDQRAYRGWFGYTFPFGLKVSLVGDQSKLETPVIGTYQKRTAWVLPVAYTFGNSTAYLSYGRAGKVNNTSNTNASQWVLGYDYALSKRTSLGANYTALNNNSGASYDFKSALSTAVTGTATITGQDARQFYLGMNHSF